MPSPIPPELHHRPVLRLHLDDVTHSATQITCASLDGGLYLARAIEHVVANLYTPHGLKEIPKVRSVTVVLRSMGGVAYTTGLQLDDLHKEIHLSLDYVQGVLSRNSPGVRHEIAGVITHEMVHCFQNNCHGTAPGGLIEGIADFVRLKAGLAPPHWNRSPENRGRKWDEGYQKTAWFLEWLEERRGPGTVSRMNEIMGEEKYDEKKLWHDVFGESVDRLWNRYRKTWEADDQIVTCGTSMSREPSSTSSEAEMVDLSEEERHEATKEERQPQKFVA
ncbi:uncharacterized protein Z518_07750 [Rhinocladiella mackenziei CBS 650.93]|uniref:PBSP domain protein n=1 Tax=Rhinocladiella mackenziei CBS 650.93 TaxID=1442369 RepID=A0A0D2ILY8_9EURO|nr:uncharacterized protein Z518_07750 [Rhinocladiella mackenziei CBS 650.93]KIX04196.1 hypothetical protein Z518_07750 [Rhinocladiella mackenziei CBS 650.93]